MDDFVFGLYLSPALFSTSLLFFFHLLERNTLFNGHRIAKDDAAIH